MKNNNLDRETLQKNGWLLVKNFFDESYSNSLREACIQSSKEGLNGVDLLSNKYLSYLFTNEKFVKLMSELIGGRPVYFGDSSCHIASVVGGISNGFHKDSIDRKNKNGIDWGNDYSLIRVGIYLQDHKNYSEGLVVRTGSHKTPDLSVGEKVNVPSQKGDLIIWYLTTTHSGNAKRIKWFDFPVLMGNKTGGWLACKLYYHLPKMFIQPSEKDRVALFMTFGKNDKHLKRYIDYLKYRSYMVNFWKNSNYDKETLNKIKTQDFIDTIDMKEDASKISSLDYPEYDFDQFHKFDI